MSPDFNFASLHRPCRGSVTRIDVGTSPFFGETGSTQADSPTCEDYSPTKQVFELFIISIAATVDEINDDAEEMTDRMFGQTPALALRS